MFKIIDELILKNEDQCAMIISVLNPAICSKNTDPTTGNFGSMSIEKLKFHISNGN